MIISNLKDLAKLIDLCRKKGIDQIKVDNLEVKIGSLPSEKYLPQGSSGDIKNEDTLSADDVLNWSAHQLDGAM